MIPGPPDTLRIQTAENVGLGYDIAGLGSRVLAQCIDVCIIVPVMFVLIIAGSGLVNLFATTDTGTYFGEIAVVTVAGVVYYVYFAILEAVMNGQTPGKRSLNLRVVRADGSAIGATESLLRNLVRFVDITFFFIGVLLIFGTPRSQRLGDLAARTLVVRIPRRWSLPAAARPPVMLRSHEAGPPLGGIDHIGAHEYSVLRAFLARPDLHVMQRQRIAAQMAGTLLERMHLSSTAPERTLVPEVFLERLYLQLAQRIGER